MCKFEGIFNIFCKMMKYCFVAAFLFLGFISCKNIEEKTEIKNKTEELPEESGNEIFIIDVDFINNPFEFGRVNLQVLKKIFGKDRKIKKEPIENLHVEGQTDTLFTVNIKNSQFIIYKIPDNQFLESAEIKDSLIKLNRNIHTGILKKDFKEKFIELKKLNNIPDTVTIQGEDAEGYLIFTFKDNLLNKIEFVGYVD